MLLLRGIFSLAFFFVSASALDNGLALTPPMGWLSWERFRCNTDCDNDPENCISERLFKEMADVMASEGYKELGYEYVIIDDCWLEPERDAEGKLQADRKRFPNGIKHLADYIHSKGLKFGIYEDYGNETCAGYPGLIGHMEDDANTLASWEIDYIKVDGCNSDPRTMDIGYPQFGYYLNKTGRPIVYSCEWPLYLRNVGIEPDYTLIAKYCNLWRNYDDVEDSWSSVSGILQFYAETQDEMQAVAGPGQWNDPDMLVIGNFGLSYEQSKAQMAIWSVLASPLIMSTDLRNIKPEYKAILQNKQIIAVNQDPLGRQARFIHSSNNIFIWRKEITPTVKKYYSYAIVFLSLRSDGMPFPVSITLKELGLSYRLGYRIKDLYDDTEYGILFPTDTISVQVNPSGVVMLRADINKPSKRFKINSNMIMKKKIEFLID